MGVVNLKAYEVSTGNLLSSAEGKSKRYRDYIIANLYDRALENCLDGFIQQLTSNWASKITDGNQYAINFAIAPESGGVNDGENPHVWFSADVRKAVAQAITEAYEQADAAKKSDFDKLHDQWKSEENNVESKIAEVKQKSDGLAYAATESVASYLAEDMGLTDATPSGYARATANESEPTPTDIRQFADALKSGEIKLLIVNTQEESELTGKITNAAKSANVPMVELTEQMPEQYDSLTAWMESLVDAFSKAIA